MTPDLVREIIASGSAMLSSMAQAAKTTGEHLYSVLVRQQMIEGIGNLIGVSFLIFFTWLIFKKFSVPYYKKCRDNSDEQFGIVVVSILLWVVGVILTFFITDAVKHIINPEFYALKFIFDSVKGSK